MKPRTFALCGQLLWWIQLATLLMAIFAMSAVVFALQNFHQAHGLKILLLGIAIGIDFYLVLATGIAWLAYSPKHRDLSVQFACLAGASLFCALVGCVAYWFLKSEF